MELNLLEKTELKVYGLILDKANLSVVAQKVAAVLELPLDSVLVVDVRPDHICLDILEKQVNMRQITGKGQAILEALKQVAGLTVTSGAYVDSAGIMGLIAFDEQQAEQVIARTQQMAGEVEKAVLKRAMVFATGFEVKNGMITDTNSPFLLDLLKAAGYRAEFGGILDDDVAVIKRRLAETVERGFGLVITTGGVGAEDKDFSVEATCALDKEAATPWIVKFQQGTGRHVKTGVRIGVGQIGLATVINLPGPHDEVVVSAEALKRHCQVGRIDKQALAEDLAVILRNKLSGKHWHHKHEHEVNENGKNHH